MAESLRDTKELERFVTELTEKYNSGLRADIEFEALKKIYLELKDIKAKLLEIKNASQA